jgi:1-deoxy-D-xylulose-5-phosphate synthase
MPENHSSHKPLLAHLSDAQAEELCQQLRQELIADVSRTGGHLASNLGVVELTVAIHRVFDTSWDRLVFDVGHQCYPHKMLTGRREQMSSLRQLGGIAGFPKPSESVHDAFIAGHASNSVAVAVGMARARTLMGQDYHVLALIGDGALTGGLAYEGLSTAGESREPMLVILNDNGMSITKNVGAVAEHLARQRLKPQYLTFKKTYRKVMNSCWLGRKVYWVTHKLKKAVKESLLPSSMFENMGFTYLGPVNGHDVSRLTKTLRYAKDLKEPVLLHVRTVKGKDFQPAQDSPDAFHGVAPFDPETGELRKAGGANFASVFGAALTKLAWEDKRVCAITAAMLTGTGLEQFQAEFPQRCFDVGIAEGCAVSMAAGLAQQGMIPVFAVYSTFLQRAYDMMLHDVALSGLHVVFGVDRAGLVGEDGETHHGVFDVSFLDSIPGMTVYVPASFLELEQMLRAAVLEHTGPVAIRYPRGGEGSFSQSFAGAPAAVLRPGSDLTLVAYGTMLQEALTAAQLLEQQGIQAEVVKLNQITPLPTELVLQSVQKTGVLLVAEDCVASGSVGERLTARLEQAGIPAKTALCNTGSEFTTHASVAQLRKLLALDGAGLYQKAMEVLGHGEKASGRGDDRT